VRFLVLCRAKPDVTREQIAPHGPEEMAALQALKATGGLLQAYSPGGPGAVLIFDGERSSVDEAIASLPLIQAGLIDAEVTELHPFPGF
jgi:hypothetical protein